MIETTDAEQIERLNRRIAELLAEVAALKRHAQCALKPIGGEPKDGSPFLGYLGGLKVPYFVCWWGTSIKSSKPYICILGVGELWDHKLFPTHWAPLPDDSTLTSTECGEGK